MPGQTVYTTKELCIKRKNLKPSHQWKNWRVLTSKIETLEQFQLKIVKITGPAKVMTDKLKRASNHSI